MDLARHVRQYYLDHFDDLPLEKQLHFAGRLSLWNNDQDCTHLLLGLKESLPVEETASKRELLKLKDLLPSPGISAADLRQPYFQQYPELNGRNLMLFHVRHMRVYFGIDHLDQLLELVRYEQLAELARSLVDDEPALRILSTYAVNYLYLLEHLFPDHDSLLIDTAKLYNLGDGYDLSDPEHIRLLIYLYTHCIIADTNFYARPVNPVRKSDYLKMLTRLEAIIAEQFDRISLDNKLEFLVCAQMCGYTANLADRIYAECEQSVSPDGTYLVDTVNAFAKTSKNKSFDSSEHRNVLFVMSTTAYQRTA